MGFFDSLFKKALPHAIQDLDYKVATRDRTGFDESDFEMKLNQIRRSAMQLSGYDRSGAIKALHELERNSRLYPRERQWLNQLLNDLHR